MGRGEKILPCDAGSELRLGGRNIRRAEIIHGRGKKKAKQKPSDTAAVAVFVLHFVFIRHRDRVGSLS